MSDHGTNPPEYSHRMLTPTARRMVAAGMVQNVNRAVDGLLVADALDATAGAVLRVAGVDDDVTARGILAALWTEPAAPSVLT